MDLVSGQIRQLVERGDLTPEEGIGALILSATNDTPELRPDPKDPAFWADVGAVSARAAADVAEIAAIVARVVAAVVAVI